MTSDLAARLRASAKNWRVDGNDDEADLVSEAADFIESAEAVERERLEHEAVTGENVKGAKDLPVRLRALAGPEWVSEPVRLLITQAADELEEWRAVDHNPPPFDENGVLVADEAPPGNLAPWADLPLVPMPGDYVGRRDVYHRDMVAWAKAVMKVRPHA